MLLTFNCLMWANWQVLSFSVNPLNLPVSMAIGEVLILNWAKSDLLHLELQCFVYFSVINVSFKINIISIVLFTLSVLFKYSSVLMYIRWNSLFKSTYKATGFSLCYSSDYFVLKNNYTGYRSMKGINTEMIALHTKQAI